MATPVRHEIPRKISPQAQGMEAPRVPPAPLPTPQRGSFVPFCFCVESCFLFALTRQKQPPFCQQGYLRMQGLVGNERLRQHGVESGLLRDYAAVGKHRKDSTRQPRDREPTGRPRAPEPPAQAFNHDKEEL